MRRKAGQLARPFTTVRAYHPGVKRHVEIEDMQTMAGQLATGQAYLPATLFTHRLED